MFDQLSQMFTTIILLMLQQGSWDWTKGVMIVGLLLILKVVNRWEQVGILDWCRSIWKNPCCEYLIQGRIVTNVNFFDQPVIFPDEYHAVMYKLSTLGVDVKQAKKIGTQAKNLGGKGSSSNQIFAYTINTDQRIPIDDLLTIHQDRYEHSALDHSSTIEYFNLYLESETLNFNQIKERVDEWVDEYHRYLKEYSDGKLHLFSYMGSKEVDGHPDSLDFENTIFESSRSFDNIFFEQKETVLGRLARFTDQKEHYLNKGIPHTLGFLFHGAPGCGKTSTTKAIANLLDRHIVEVQLSRVRTCRELKEIFCCDLIDGVYLPASKKILVLEDIDCMGELVHQRDGKPKSTTKSQTKEDDDEEENRSEDDQLTLSYLLNLIDGLNEQSGRVIIMTTNHPEVLDKALIRPGRIDSIVEFKKCSREICRQMVGFYYDCELDEIDFPDYFYTPAEVFQQCLNFDDLDQTIRMLRKVESRTIM